MENSFGNLVLSLYTIIEGKTLSYGYSNREMSSSLRDFQMLFRSTLISYIENHDNKSKQFLNICVDHTQDILNDSFDFLQSNTK